MVALASGIFASIAAAVGQPLALWASAASVLALYFLFVILPSHVTARCAAGIVQVVRCRGARRYGMYGLWLGCPLLATGIVYSDVHLPEMVATEDLISASTDEVVKQPTVPNTDIVLTTDLGHPVRTHRLLGAGEQPSASMLAAQQRMIEQWDMHDRVIQLPHGWQECNCHGFAYTGGRYWVPGEQVEKILEDNGYHPQPLPRADDLAIYRDREGTILHTGIVCGLASDGVILVESKFGRAGRFIHRHEQVPYPSENCTFYRSAREGHLLRGLYQHGGTAPASNPG